MPSWLRVRGEFRERIEGFENSSFIEGRDDAYALSRFRFNVAVTANKHLAFQANLQDARVAGKEVGPTTAPFRGPFDLRTAFADVGDAKAAGSGATRTAGARLRRAASARLLPG